MCSYDTLNKSQVLGSQRGIHQWVLAVTHCALDFCKNSSQDSNAFLSRGSCAFKLLVGIGSEEFKRADVLEYWE